MIGSIKFIDTRVVSLFYWIVLKHVQMSINKSKSVGYKLYQVINSKIPLSLNTKLYIFKNYTSPILTYTSSSGTPNISWTNKSKTEAVQSITPRIITNLPWFVGNLTIRNSTDMPSISDLIAATTDNLQLSKSTSNYIRVANISKRLNNTYISYVIDQYIFRLQTLNLTLQDSFYVCLEKRHVAWPTIPFWAKSQSEGLTVRWFS